MCTMCVCAHIWECACVCVYTYIPWQCTQHTCGQHTNSWLHVHFCISIKGSRVNSQYVCSARMYYGHYHAIISHPRGNSSLPRKLMIVCELISLFFPLSISLSLFSLPLSSHSVTHTHTHTHSSRTTFSVAKGPSDPAPGCDGHV